MDEIFDPVKAVLIGTKKDDISEIELDISSHKREIFSLLKGSGTFIGQWPELDVVIMKCRESLIDLDINENDLPEPFQTEIVLGSILLIRMDENSEPKNFTLEEYQTFVEESKLHH
jgi:hypothetical protein